MATKLVSCHHIRKRRRRRRRPAAARMASTGADQRTAMGQKRENLLKLVNSQCNQTCWRHHFKTTMPKRKIPAHPSGQQCDQVNSSRSAVSKRAHLNSMLYAALLCLIVCHDGIHLLRAAKSTRYLGGLFASAESDANRLYEDLMMTYNRIVRPVQNESDRVVVRMGLKLSQLMEVNLKNQVMTTNVWLNQEWSDYKLKWDPSEYGGIEEINLPAEQIWVPDIALYNSAEGTFTVSIMTKARVRYDGLVIWNPPAIFRSSCQIDITYFPFDTQTCQLKLSSWTYGTKLDLRHINDTEGIVERGTDLSEYYQNVEWDIMEASARRNVIVYDCCPNDIYPDVTFSFTLRRKPLFYTVNLILPCVVITFFSFLVFYLPSDSGEKVTLTISILVSLIFFLSVLIETIPSTSLAMPLLGKYLVFTMILITMSVCATVCVLNIHFRTPSTHSMPAWIKHWCMDVLPKYLFMSVPQYQSQQDQNILPENLIYAHNPAYAAQSAPAPSNAIQRQRNEHTMTSSQQQQQQQQQQHQLNVADYLMPVSLHENEQEKLSSNGRRPAASAETPAHRKQASSDERSSSSNNPLRLASGNKGSRSDARPLELSASNLAAGGPNVLQGRPPSILPYLHSEAARRLQLQRSRSSERETRSNSDNQPPSNSAAARSTSEARPAEHRHQIHTASGTGSKSCDRKRPNALDSAQMHTNKQQPKASPFWRLFKSSKSTNSNSTLDHETKQAAERGRRRSRSSSSSSSSSGLRRYGEDDDDEYQHHRHFQARASICSNNLWRIGPTRRCSLAVPTNYPTYYRPLAQLHQHRGSNQSGVSTINELSQGQHVHYHTHARDGDSMQSSASTDTSQYQMGTVVGSLIQASATNLLRPRQIFAMQNTPRRGEEREMNAFTSGGFIRTGPSGAGHGLSAIPPRDIETPSSFQSESQQQMPTPPPPLPPEFGDTRPARVLLSSAQRQKFQWTGRDQSSSSSQLVGASGLACASPATGYQQANSIGAQPNQRQYMRVPVNLLSSGYAPQQHQLINMPLNRPVNNGGRSAVGQSASLNLLGQQTMPRSQSTDHRLASIMSQAEPRLAAKQQTQIGAQVYSFGPQMGQPVPGYQSIGRQLGQAYIQRLERQPAMGSSVNLNLVRNLAGFSPASQQIAPSYINHQRVLANNNLSLRAQQPGCGIKPQTNQPEAGIDMLRRSKSQTSLSRRGPGQASIECKECLTAVGQQPAHPMDQMSSYRTQSAMRGRFNSTGCRQGASSACGVNASDEVFRYGRDCSPNITASLRNSSTSRKTRATNNHQTPLIAGCNGGACKCFNGALAQSANQANSNLVHPPSSQQLSSLSMIKLISEVDKAIQNAMFIAQHIDNLDEFESVKENWKYIAMVIDRIFLIIFLFACIVGTVAIFALVPWSYYLNEKPIDLQLTKLLALNLTSSEMLATGCHDF